MKTRIMFTVAFLSCANVYATERAKIYVALIDSIHSRYSTAERHHYVTPVDPTNPIIDSTSGPSPQPKFFVHLFNGAKIDKSGIINLFTDFVDSPRLEDFKLGKMDSSLTLDLKDNQADYCFKQEEGDAFYFASKIYDTCQGQVVPNKLLITIYPAITSKDGKSILTYARIRLGDGNRSRAFFGAIFKKKNKDWEMTDFFGGPEC